MTGVKNFILILLLFWGSLATAQKQKVKLGKEEKQLYANLQQHVRFLSDDRLEGRRTGTPGEKMAADYIREQFRAIGMQPKASNEFFQPFDVWEGKEISPSTYLTIDGKVLQLHKEFFPMVYSPDITIEAMPSIALKEYGMPWFLDLNDLIQANRQNPHFDLNEDVRNKAKAFKKKGATALFIYNSGTDEDGIKFDGKDKSEMLPIPVVYLSKEAAAKFLLDEASMLDMKLKTEIGEKKRTGTNVIGFIDNGAPATIVFGAHFDHLGYGEDQNSLHSGKAEIHNGADDNASGTSALIELARLLKNARLRSNNYLFIAFSGEEQGLYGSKYFTQNPTVQLGEINFMINMDMIGRLNDSSRVVTVGGYGTSPAWGELYGRKGKNSLYTGSLVFRFDSSGTGPSDHTSFYRKNIPVLFYFTGLHADYHKPSDDFDKVNFTGQLLLVKHIMSLIEAEDRQKRKLTFLKTREAQMTTSARFSVSLGIMPDYTFSGAGVRADGVSDGRPAQKAGIKAGDIIIALDEMKTTSMESYMQALSKYKKGDRVKVTYLRGKETLSTTAEF